MRINTRSITLAATLTALCFVTGLLPFVFFLPVMVAATTLSVGMAAFVGLAFGAVSIMYSFTMPMSMAATGFIQAPYIAIFPRILAALGAFGMYKLITHFAKPQKKPAQAATIAAASATGSLLNTALVVGMFVLILPDLMYDGVTMMVAAAEMLINGAIEFVCMAVLTPPISLTLDKVVLHGKRLGKIKRAEKKVDVGEEEHADADVKANADIKTETDIKAEDVL